MPLEVTPYQQQWITQFRETATGIRGALGDLAVRIDHIGSTAVAGLHAKPIIDIQLTVARLDTVSYCIAALTAQGFEHRPDTDSDRPPWWETQDPCQWRKQYFRRTTEAMPRVHLHVRESGRLNQRYALLFRDYLRASERARQAYGEYKLRLAEVSGHLSSPGGTGPYLDLKDPVLDLIADAAQRWALEINWHAGPTDA